MSWAYYNEIDPFAAEWLRTLSMVGLIAPGEVDERSIVDVRPEDLKGFAQCHFFAGIGGWAYALRLAGWPDDRPVWTGSCPCQPFSAAGKRGGTGDKRHLWPEFFRLIAECRPPVVLGEQVASKDGLDWLDLVHADLEGAGYAVGAVDCCAAGVGAPHIRQRLWFVAEREGVEHAARDGRQERRTEPVGRGVEPRCGVGGLADADDARPQGRGERGDGAGQRAAGPRGVAGGVADADGGDSSAERQQRGGEQRQQPQDGGAGGLANRPGPPDSPWGDPDWLFCRDGKWRPVEPGTFPLAYGLPARVGRLRGYGNAIVPQVAAAVIAAYMDC